MQSLGLATDFRFDDDQSESGALAHSRLNGDLQPLFPGDMSRGSARNQNQCNHRQFGQILANFFMCSPISSGPWSGTHFSTINVRNAHISCDEYLTQFRNKYIYNPIGQSYEMLITSHHYFCLFLFLPFHLSTASHRKLYAKPNA